MAQSKAIAQTLTGMKDFPGDKHAVTLSNGGPGVLIDCLKCTNCGWSMTIPTSPEKIEIPPKVVDQEVEDKFKLPAVACTQLRKPKNFVCNRKQFFLRGIKISQ